VFSKKNKGSKKRDETNLVYQNVVSAYQISLYGDLCWILGSKGIEFKTETKYDSDMKLPDTPFEVSIRLKTSKVEYWIYTDGADANGELELRYEREDFETLDELKEEYIKQVNTYLVSSELE